MTLSTVVLLQHVVKSAEKERRRPLHVVGMVRRQETVDVCNYIVGAGPRPRSCLFKRPAWRRVHSLEAPCATRHRVNVNILSVLAASSRRGCFTNLCIMLDVATRCCTDHSHLEGHALRRAHGSVG